MTTTTTESTATEGQETQQAGQEGKATEQDAEEKKTETVDFWKQKAREQEKRAKENSDAAERLKEIEDAQKSEAQKAAERISELEGEIPKAINTAFREAAVAFGGISREDADLFLTGTDAETLAKQAARLGARVAEQQAQQKKTGNRVAKEGTSTAAGATDADEEREFARGFFSGDGGA